jgi:hypothetical protein
MIVYALSAACGCAPAGISYYRSYYPLAEPAVIEYRSGSEWGGETALPIGYSVPSPYYVGAPTPYINPPYPYYLDARHANHTRFAKTAAAKRPSVHEAKVPIPKPRPSAKIAAKIPPHTKAIVE